MTFQNKFEKYLKDAPKPSAPDGLLNKLEADVSLREMKTHQFSLRKWFVPTGRSVSSWRVAAAIAIIVLLPLSYGATKLIKRFINISQLPAIEVDFPSTGALSPDAKYFAGNTWNSELIVIDTSTGKQRKIAENCYGPVVWSAQGSEIATMSGQEESVLVAVSMETAKTRTLLEDPPVLQDWSPDGKFILGVRRPSASVYSAVMVNLENKEETVLVEKTESAPSPRFSPNGDRISYTTTEESQYILHLRTTDGRSHVKYTNFQGAVGQPLWSPDGAYVVFTGIQEGLDRQYKDLWALRVQGNRFAGEPFPVVPDVEQMEFYNWSRNGQLAYRTSFELGGRFVLPVDPQTGKAAGPPRQLVRQGGLEHCWSPDGNQMALRKAGELTFISAASGQKTRKLPLFATDFEPAPAGRNMAWSPDGRWIAFSGWDKKGRTGIFLITVETGEVKLLVPLETRVANFHPTWAPDSKNIAYAYQSNVYIVNIEDRRSVRIATSAGEKNEIPGRPVFAPDGRSVTYMLGPRILATTLNGEETRELFHLKDKNISGINIYDLAPDGRHIVFTPGNREIWCAATDGSEPFQIADLSKLGDQAWAWLPKWSPKGDAIAFSVNHEKSQYWVMENFLPAK
ncbi:MAG: PD40 domain-containing protein [Sedimentisphaerales bacterium]|nr:PD40 domain-containing protein [Sedimentisphaerales bacterium]